MRLLLDTHVLIWWLGDDPRLSASHRVLIASPDNEVLVSAVSVSEIAIKSSLDKLTAPSDLVEQIVAGGFTSLPLGMAHAATLALLPWHHRDPFDRMLIAQAMVEGVPLATSDARISVYDVQVV